MEKYEPNSHISKEKREVPKKVITGNVKTKKKNGAQRFFNMIIQEDVGSVWSYILTDVMVPACKKIFVDAVNNAANMFVYGSSGGERKTGTNASRVSYRRYYDEPDNRYVSRRPKYETPTRVDYEDIIFSNREDAEEVLNCMSDLINRYHVVRVADLYELVGITGSYTDNNYGWTNIDGAGAIRVSDGYILKLPKPLPID